MKHLHTKSGYGPCSFQLLPGAFGVQANPGNGGRVDRSRLDGGGIVGGKTMKNIETVNYPQSRKKRIRHST
jgi:hypothetical protein